MKVLRPPIGDVSLIVLAVVFGWALWYTVREELSESQRREVQIVIEAEAGLDATPRVQSVTLEVQGARRAVDSFRVLPSPRVVRRLTHADLPPGSDETRRDFSKEDLDFAEALGGGGLTVLDMKPAVVSVKVFRVEVQEKTVAPPELQGAADLGLRHVLQGYTNTAKVRGAVSVLSTFREIRTFVSKEHVQASAEEMRDEVRAVKRLVLDIDPNQRDLFTLVEPRELTARVELSRVAKQEIVVPLSILDDTSRQGAARRRLQFAEINKPYFVAGARPQVRLQLTGALAALGSVVAAKVRAFVLESDLPDDQRNGDVAVHVADLPPGVALSEEYSVYVEECR